MTSIWVTCLHEYVPQNITPKSRLWYHCIDLANFQECINQQSDWCRILEDLTYETTQPNLLTCWSVFWALRAVTLAKLPFLRKEGSSLGLGQWGRPRKDWGVCVLTCNERKVGDKGTRGGGKTLSLGSFTTSLLCYNESVSLLVEITSTIT